MPVAKSLIAVLALATGSVPARASAIDESASVPAAGTVHRLSPEEVEAVKDAAAKRNVNASSLDDETVAGRRVHGEVGFGIGTGSYNSVFGTAIVPLGDDGFAALSFERSDFGRRRYRR